MLFLEEQLTANIAAIANRQQFIVFILIMIFYIFFNSINLEVHNVPVALSTRAYAFKKILKRIVLEGTEPEKKVIVNRQHSHSNRVVINGIFNNVF